MKNGFDLTLAGDQTTLAPNKMTLAGDQMVLAGRFEMLRSNERTAQLTVEHRASSALPAHAKRGNPVPRYGPKIGVADRYLTGARSFY